MSEDRKARTIIMSAEAWEKLKQMADADRRKLNAQMEHLIMTASEARTLADA